MSLTPRAGGLLGAGLAVTVLAAVLDQRDLLRVGLLLLAIVVVAAVVTPRRRHRVEVARTVTPARVQIGEEAVVHLRVRNTGPRRASHLRLADEVDPTLGPPARLLLAGLPAGASVDASYVVRPPARGVYRLGPAAVHSGDPFGLVADVQPATGEALLTVTPVVARLHRHARPPRAGAAGDSTSRRSLLRGEDDVGTRTYRPGDELRRVHWPATARTGVLMVREEHQPHESHALVLLDTRSSAHQGWGHDPDASSLEWAVHAAASLCVHLTRDGRRVRLVTPDHDPGPTGMPADAALQVLAAVPAAGTADRMLVVPRLQHGSSTASSPPPSLVVAVLGALDPAGPRTDGTGAAGSDTAALATLLSTTTTNVALVTDPATWTTADRSGLGHRSRNGAARHPLPASCDALAATGWGVGVARRGAAVDDVWAEALR